MDSPYTKFNLQDYQKLNSSYTSDNQPKNTPNPSKSSIGQANLGSNLNSTFTHAASHNKLTTRNSNASSLTSHVQNHNFSSGSVSGALSRQRHLGSNVGSGEGTRHHSPQINSLPQSSSSHLGLKTGPNAKPAPSSSSTILSSGANILSSAVNVGSAANSVTTRSLHTTPTKPKSSNMNDLKSSNYFKSSGSSPYGRSHAIYEKKSSLNVSENMRMAFLCSTWYILSSVGNVLNKHILTKYFNGYPTTVSFSHIVSITLLLPALFKLWRISPQQPLSRRYRAV